MLADVLPRCFQGVFFENGGEVAAVVEGQFFGHIGYGEAFQKKFLGFADFFFIYVVAGRGSHYVAEFLLELGG